MNRITFDILDEDGKRQVFRMHPTDARLLEIVDILRSEKSIDELVKRHAMRVISESVTMKEAAEVLGVGRKTLWVWRKKWEEGETAKIHPFYPPKASHQ